MKIKAKTKILNYFLVAYLRKDHRYNMYLNRTFMWLQVCNTKGNDRLDVVLTKKDIECLDLTEIRNETYRRKKKN